MDSKNNKEVGRLGEGIAAKFLERKGFKIVEMNYRKPWGEIDIISMKGDVMHFVEVKTVSREMGQGNGSREIDYRPEEMVTPSKLEKVARTASLYMETMHDSREYQIDVIGVVLDSVTKTAKCRFFEQVLG